MSSQPCPCWHSYLSPSFLWERRGRSSICWWGRWRRCWQRTGREFEYKRGSNGLKWEIIVKKDKQVGSKDSIAKETTNDTQEVNIWVSWWYFDLICLYLIYSNILWLNIENAVIPLFHQVCVYNIAERLTENCELEKSIYRVLELKSLESGSNLTNLVAVEEDWDLSVAGVLVDFVQNQGCI